MVISYELPGRNIGCCLTIRNPMNKMILGCLLFLLLEES